MSHSERYKDFKWRLTTPLPKEILSTNNTQMFTDYDWKNYILKIMLYNPSATPRRPPAETAAWDTSWTVLLYRRKPHGRHYSKCAGEPMALTTVSVSSFKTYRNKVLYSTSIQKQNSSVISYNYKERCILKWERRSKKWEIDYCHWSWLSTTIHQWLITWTINVHMNHLYKSIVQEGPEVEIFC